MLGALTIPSEELICVICHKPVRLETAKTDDDGQAVHEECYAWKVASDAKAKTNPSAEWSDAGRLPEGPIRKRQGLVTAEDVANIRLRFASPITE